MFLSLVYSALSLAMDQLKQLGSLLGNKTSPNEDVDLETLTKGDVASSRKLISLGLGFEDLATILQIIRDVGSGKPLDDRDLLLEKVVSLLQRLPTGGLLESKISDVLITGLYHDLPHPAATLIGPDYRYRRADGSANNPFNHSIGAAGQPYGRTVAPMKPKSPYLPDPEAVYDQLLRRRSFTPHKAGLNRFFFSFATTVIHECFQSNYQKPWINQTSSYVELSCLYGNNQAEQDKVRTFVQGRIFPDTISSTRLMLMPPGAVAVMMIFSRHHNYLAERMFEINECGKYKPWDQCTDDEKAWQDNDIFQLCRNINVAFYAKTVLTDYVSAILNTIRSNSEWYLELGKEIKNRDGTRVERGVGNTVTCEFNVLYHWHAILSASDDKWMTKELRDFYPDIDPEDLTSEQFGLLMHKKGMDMEAIPPSQRTFYGMQRDEEGRFDDQKLSELLKDCTDEPARAFGARATPSSLKVVEIMGQLQARNTFHCATMNEFREYLHLKKFESFLEWNPDPDVAMAAERLYGHVDNLELYPGLMAEEPKPNMKGSGVQVGHTIGRGILDDAVALVRGDRFLTYDLNADTLTSWGLAQIKGIPGGYGGHLGVVLARALPSAWGHGRSPYCLLPFFTPVAIKQILTENGVADHYDLERPPSMSKMHCFTSFQACKKALGDPANYATQYAKNARLIAGSSNFFMAWDDAKTLQSSKATLQKAFMEPGFDENLREAINALTIDKIALESFAFDRPATRRQLNVVRDVFNVVPIIWMADKFGIPLRSQAKPHGLMTVPQLHAIMVAFYVFITFDVMPNMSWRLHEAAEKLAPSCRKILETRFSTTANSATQKITDFLTKGSSYQLSKSAHHFYDTMHKAHFSMDAAVDAILGIMLPTGSTIAWQCSLLLDLFLSPGKEYAKDRLCQLAKRQDEESWREFAMWVYEGIRLRPHLPGAVREVMHKTTMQDGDCTINLKAGDIVLLCKTTAHMDPIAFPEPETLNPNRPMKNYVHLDIGLHSTFGAQAAVPAIVAMLRPIFQLRNLRRAKGSLGRLITVQEPLNVMEGECLVNMFVDDLCNENIVPTSMMIEYDSP